MVRISAAIACIVLAALLTWTIADRLGPDPYVRPTNGVTSGGPQDSPLAARQETLRARTALQDWRTGAPPSQAREQASGAPSTPRTEQSSPDRLVQGWVGQRGADWNMLRAPQRFDGTVNLPSARAGVLVQPEGRDWRRTHNGFMNGFGGVAILGASLLLALFLLIRGRIPLELGFSGKKVLRFTSIERANHWMTAVSFIVMALTGLIVLYGRHILRPLTGAELFSGIASASLSLHIAFAIPFVVGVVAMIVLWIRQNLPDRLDLHWLARFGGFLNNSPDKPPARRFNAGQKLVFWAVAIGGLLLFASGFLLVFPLFWLGIGATQITMVFHTVLALLMIAAILGHIYIGTIGMVGSFDAMWDGQVDRNWAEEHHRLWLARMEGRPEDAVAVKREQPGGAHVPAVDAP